MPPLYNENLQILDMILIESSISKYMKRYYKLSSLHLDFKKHLNNKNVAAKEEQQTLTCHCWGLPPVGSTSQQQIMVGTWVLHIGIFNKHFVCCLLRVPLDLWHHQQLLIFGCPYTRYYKMTTGLEDLVETIVANLRNVQCICISSINQ